jgi:lipopolysaccharide biosynthesis glycosyltransferase
MTTRNIIYLINVNNGSYADYTYPLIEQYAEKCNADIAVYDNEVFRAIGAPHPNFLIFDIMRHFVTTDYNKMLYIDMDIRILPQSPNIFNEVTKFGMVQDHKADLWRREAMQGWLDNHHPGMHVTHYFNGGVMVSTKKSILKLLNVVPEDIIAFWNTTKDVFPHGYNQNILNYCIIKSEIIFEELPDKWNKVCRKAGPDDYFIHYVANKTQIQTGYDKFKDNKCNPDITMTLDTLRYV